MHLLGFCFLLLVSVAPVQAVLLDPPGNNKRPDKLRQDLRETYLDKKGSYVIRTRYLGDGGVPKYTNRLVNEDSPYLLQHAHNPVDWHPWGPAAFALALKENKPVFLSIGYSTCHWCHVMERESFDNESIASLLNKNFISIKVDREQRPDIDEIYMTGVQLMTGRGGWPMSNFLTAEGKPFHGGTYFPPGDFVNLLNRVNEVWQTQKDVLSKQADNVSNAIARITAAQNTASEIDHLVVRRAVKDLISSHDSLFGGFGRSIKFPHESNLLLLLYAWQRDSDELALKAATKSLDGMAAGGIYDQVGGGFHRYSTDREWLVPHFEKMLYNQAQLVRVYTKAYEITGKESYGRIVQQTLDYVLRDMRAETGAFYSATDADSEDEEGLFYLWTPMEMAEVLSDNELSMAQELFGITQAGNFEKRNIPTLALPLEDYARKHNLNQALLIQEVEIIRRKLYIEREERIHPLRDEKIISAWNGMMISAFVLAARELGRNDYLQAAMSAGNEIWSGAWSQEYKLRRIMLNGNASIAGTLEDYAYLAQSFLFLFDATGDDLWQVRSRLLAKVMFEEFWDNKNGGFFIARVNPQEPSIARPKSPADGAIASGNSVALNLLVKLHQRTGELRYKQGVTEMITAFSGAIKSSPSNFSTMLLGVDDFYEGSIDAIQFSSSGHVKVNVRVVESKKFEVDLAISSGWHINANKVYQVDLIATRVETQDENWVLDEIIYPPGIQRELGFQGEPLNLYEDHVLISGSIKQSAITPLPLVLHLQVCNDEICLPPERLNFKLSDTATPVSSSVD